MYRFVIHTGYVSGPPPPSVATMAELRRTIRRFLRFGPILLLVLALAACGTGGGSDELVDDDGGGDLAGEGERGPAVGDDADAGGDEGRQVITTGSLTVAVDDPLSAADEATRIAAGAGGRVDHRSERPEVEGTPASASLTLRVPADRLTDVLEDLESLGQPRDLALERQDVTLTVRDLDARIQALEVSIARLEDLMAAATSTGDLLEAEAALTERQAELDSLQSQRTYLGEQVALATIRLFLVSRETAPSPAPGGFWGGLVSGWTALVNTLNRAIEVVGALVPWAIFGALVVADVLLVRRLRPRRPGPPESSATAPSVAQAGPPPVHPGAPTSQHPGPPPTAG